MNAPVSTRYRIFTSPRLMAVVLLIAGVMCAISAVLFQAPETFGQKRALSDFDAFYIAGTMAANGHASDAYEQPAMQSAQQSVAKTQYMPYTYPPAFTLLADGLARLPIGLAFFLFTASSLAFYLHVMRRLAGEFLPGVLVAILPAIIIILRTGQNGFLTGGLIGWFVLAFLRNRRVAGLPLGLMLIKPHLAGGAALLAVLERRWQALAIAAAVVVTFVLITAIAFGPATWLSFVDALGDAAGFLASGYYLMFRMSSIYACVLSLGGSPALAAAIHAAGALIATGAVLVAWRKGIEPRLLAAVACVASISISPYAYDYDLTILGLAIALVIGDVLRRAMAIELVAMFALTWVATGYGLVSSFHVSRSEAPGLQAEQPPSLIALAMIALILITVRVLTRATAPKFTNEVPSCS